MAKFEIYALHHPETGEVRYIGKANNSVQRLKSHIRDSRRRDTPVYRWIRKLLAAGLAPTVSVLEVTDDWQAAERRLIAVSRENGVRLLNVAEGGYAPHQSPEQSRACGNRLQAYLASNPREDALRKAKRHLASGLRYGGVNNATRVKLRLLAEKLPRMFGEWAALPDRVEHASAV